MEENRSEANKIENSLVNLMKLLESAPKSDVKQIEIFYKIRIAELIFYFNSKNQNQEGSGLKILTPNQLLSRLPILLAQLNARNNSEKLKNKVRQLLNSLYRSKKLTKKLYKSLIDII